MTPLQMSELMEGGLAKLAGNPFPAAVYVVTSVLLDWALLWAEAGDVVHVAVAYVVYLVAFFLISSMFTLALGGKLLVLFRNPSEFLNRIVFALVAWVIVTIGAGIGLILLVVPGLYLSARWFVSAQVILLDGAEIGAGLRRSWALTEGSAWSILGVYLVLLLPSFLPLLTGQAYSGSPSLGLILEWTVTNAVGAFGVAVAVHAWHRLTGQIDELEQTFA